MRMISEVKNLIAECINSVFASKLLDISVTPESIKLEQIRHNIQGDVYTNAAIVYAKRSGLSVQELAHTLIDKIKSCKCIEDLYCADSGFINITINKKAWQNNIGRILSLGRRYGSHDVFSGKTVNVEFVSANPTGPLHTGHARNAILGSCIANLLEKVGYKVVREFYINDMGNQIKLLGKSLYLRYREICGEDIVGRFSDPDMYHGDYVKQWALKLFETYGDDLPLKDRDNEAEAIGFCSQYALNCSLQQFTKDLDLLGVTMDVYTSEKEIMSSSRQVEAFDILQNAGVIFKGVLPRPQSSEHDDDWEERPQVLFKSTQYGDDRDRAIKKSNGEWTYFASDIAYHYDKLSRGYDRLVNIFGSDHIGYIKRIKAAVAAMCPANKCIQFDIIAYQLVNLIENNVPIKMSKRSGNFITLRDVVEKVGKNITRFNMVSRDSNSVIDFDFAKVVEMSLENPLFYIQYCHARICSVFRNYEEQYGELDFGKLQDIANDLNYVNSEEEIEIIRVLAFYPDIVLSSAMHLEPHRVCNYLRDLSKSFHYLWSHGKMNASLRFIDTSNKQRTLERMCLIKAVQIVMQDALAMLGIDPVFEMK